MKRVFNISVLIVFFALSSYVVMGCSCLRDSVKKRYKKAEAVFIGQVASGEEIPDNDSLIQGDGVETLKVIKSWKGINKKFVGVNFNYPEKDAGMCFDFSHFEENKKYLVFAYGKNLEVETVCSDIFEISNNSEAKGHFIVKKEMTYLDKFRSFLWGN